MEMEELTYKVRGCLFKVHTSLGPGLLESIYEEALMYELETAGIKYKTQVFYPVFYNGKLLNKEFRLDLLVEDKLIIELKSVEGINDVFKKQLLTYLKITKLELGLLVNFNVAQIKDGIIRIINSQ
jgi:GxxExxY protein